VRQWHTAIIFDEVIAVSIFAAFREIDGWTAVKYVHDINVTATGRCVADADIQIRLIGSENNLVINRQRITQNLFTI